MCDNRGGWRGPEVVEFALVSRLPQRGRCGRRWGGANLGKTARPLSFFLLASPPEIGNWQSSRREGNHWRSVWVERHRVKGSWRVGRG